MALKAVRISVTVPGEWAPLIDERMSEEHIPSRSRFLLSCLMFDLITRSRHKITGPCVTEPEEVFYRIVAEVVKDFPNADGRTVSPWLRHRLEELRDEGRATD